jgi:Uma2 family endonuclease
MMPVQITRRRFDVDDYHRMAAAGILSEDDRVELIDGEIVTMTPIGPRHNAAVDRANRALVTAVGDRAIVRVQGSVRLDRFHEPQPDLTLLRPRPDFYASTLPGPSDILLIIEVADATLEYDRQLKRNMYASAAVPEYWLVNLDAHTIVRHTNLKGSEYHDVREYRRGDDMPLPTGGTVRADVLLLD